MIYWLRLQNINLIQTNHGSLAKPVIWGMRSGHEVVITPWNINLNKIGSSILTNHILKAKKEKKIILKKYTKKAISK